MISLPTAAPLSAAQSAGQPSQTFSDSLLAASKSFQQTSSTSDGDSKSGHRQRTDSDDAKTPDAAPASDSAVGSIVVLPAVPQQIEKTVASVPALENASVGSTATDGISTDVAGLFAQSLTTVSFMGTGSSTAQTSTGATSIALPVGIQSGFTSASTQFGTFATYQNASSGADVPATSNALSAGRAETSTSAFQTDVAQASSVLPMSVQSNFTPVEMPIAESTATTQEPSNAVVGQPAQDVAAVQPSENQTSVAQSSNAPAIIPQPAIVESKITQAQMPAAEPMAAMQNTSETVTSRQSGDVTAADVSEIQTRAAQTSVAGLATTQNTVTVDASQPDWNVRTTAPVETQSITSDAVASQADHSQQTIIEPASVQSNVTPASNDLPQSFSGFVAAPVQEMTAPIAASPKSENADPNAAAAIPDSAVSQNNSGAQDSLSTAALNTPSNAAQNTVVNNPIDPSPVPVLPAAQIASAKEVSAQALKADTTVQTDPQPAVSDQTPATATMSAPGVIADQLAASPLSAGQLGVNQIGVSSLKPLASTKAQTVDSKNGKDSGTERTGLKKSAEPETEKGLKSSSQDATASGDQGQGGNDSQAQVAVSVPVNFTVHPAAVIVAAQNVAHVATNHTSSSADAAGIGVKTADNAAMNASTALPQTLPVINTAKLIQSMGQSEMRVGMRSNEFGNISISTSTSKDQVSAQISLEHGELAKTLAASLPEMQARLGGNHPMDVRIDMNGATTGQGTGTYGGTSHGSQDQSSSGRQQAGNMAASSSSIGSVEKQFSPVAVVMPTGYARLDIRV